MDQQPSGTPTQDLARTVLAVLSLGGLIAVAIWVLKPFLPALIWAVMIVVATWPLMLKLQAYLWGRRALAVTAMTLALLCVFIVPLLLAVVTIAENADRIAGWLKTLAGMQVPPPPHWIAGIPLVGERLASVWQQVAVEGYSELAARAAPYVKDLGRWIVGHAGGAGAVFLQLLLTVILSAILYSVGEDAAQRVLLFGRRLAGARGEGSVRLASQAIRGVALGVVVTALVQSILGGIGVAIAGVPFAAVLTALMFMLAIAQIGPAPVLALSVGWLYWQGDNGWATALLVWSIAVSALDNILRPLLIRRGAELPLLLIFAGVIGGLLAYGVVGIFIGPVVLAVAFKLLEAWIDEAADRRDTGDLR
ncbi:MAG TPA: AI-2E family transporter YdiK [Burkholderiales bacterium]|nr:AI-2E family transporter YdiK [Burkholderiales bacterium]